MRMESEGAKEEGSRWGVVGIFPGSTGITTVLSDSTLKNSIANTQDLPSLCSLSTKSQWNLCPISLQVGEASCHVAGTPVDATGHAR